MDCKKESCKLETNKHDWKKEFAEKTFTIGATEADLDAASKLKKDKYPSSSS
jgi:hypothetical protein